jgi:hypothetical protein
MCFFLSEEKLQHSIFYNVYQSTNNFEMEDKMKKTNSIFGLFVAGGVKFGAVFNNVKIGKGGGGT